MSDDYNLAEFFTEVAAESRVTVVDKEALRDGVLVTYHGAKPVKDNTLHLFSTLDTEEPRAFGTWGTGELTQKLAKVKKGAIVFLCYRGKLSSDDGSGVPMHRFVVNIATRPLADLPEAARAVWHKTALALEKAIDVAAADAAARFAERVQNNAGRGAQTDDEAYWASLQLVR